MFLRISHIPNPPQSNYRHQHILALTIQLNPNYPIHVELMLTPNSKHSNLIYISYLVGCSVIVSEYLDHVSLNIFLFLQLQVILSDQLTVLVALNAFGLLDLSLGLNGCSLTKCIHLSGCECPDYSLHYI